MVMFDQIYPV